MHSDYFFSSLLFFFYSSADHRDLHSFPTRRSSDLLGGWPTGTAATAVSCSAWPSDRKSTRLNSSHTVISYAVFCLKKKNDDDMLLVVHSVKTRIKMIRNSIQRAGMNRNL